MKRKSVCSTASAVFVLFILLVIVVSLKYDDSSLAKYRSQGEHEQRFDLVNNTPEYTLIYAGGTAAIPDRVFVHAQGGRASLNVPIVNSVKPTSRSADYIVVNNSTGEEIGKLSFVMMSFQNAIPR
ncbi:hypothetical protein M3223_01695 [Paenibacillus pasadenensis]|uniref:hypothetical protein n=1 Tax=Paenibacillus pasadenensis TaxID=217090 RepID=UPI0020413B78|nr:hypothetical protein [Paenibacillus pasadenensis]MCM3746061.1 hypothetical protein [Paenibacillus pasadenensis]